MTDQGHRNAISRTGAQDIRVVFDENLINAIKFSNNGYYSIPPGSDSVFNIPEHTILVSRKGSSEDNDTMRVIGTANGLGYNIPASIRDDPNSDALVRALILEQFVPGGISVTPYDVVRANESGLTATVSGVDTIRAYVDTPAGVKLVLDIPSKASIAELVQREGTTPGSVPFIARPYDSELPGHKLKQALAMHLRKPQGWQDLTTGDANNRHVPPLMRAVEKYEDSVISIGISFLYAMIQSGIVAYVPPANDPRPNDNIPGSIEFRNRVDAVIDTFPAATDAYTDRIQIATALCTELASYLSPPAYPSPALARSVTGNPVLSNQMEVLRKIILTTCCQDAQRGVINGYVQVTRDDNVKVNVSTEIGFVPTSYDVAGNVMTDAHDIREIIYKPNGTFTTSVHQPHFGGALSDLKNKQANHLTQSVAAYNVAIESEERLVIGRSATAAKAGGYIDVNLFLK